MYATPGLIALLWIGFEQVPKVTICENYLVKKNPLVRGRLHASARVKGRLSAMASQPPASAVVLRTCAFIPDAVYACVTRGQGIEEIFTRMRLTVLGFHVEYFIHHKYHPKLNTVVWTLDYDRESDLGESTVRHSTSFFPRGALPFMAAVLWRH
jgi:hypothetical protein